jgi:hypothetical protein
MTAKARPCKRCKAEIPAERVEAVRGTQLCAKCSQEIGGDFKLSFTEENIAKTGSMKKNYSGVKIKKTRREIRSLDKD